MTIDNRRKRTLTDEDVEAIAAAMVNRFQGPPHACSLSLEAEDARVLKEIVSSLKKARNTIGTVVLTFFLLGILGLITKGFWGSLMEK